MQESEARRTTIESQPSVGLWDFVETIPVSVFVFDQSGNPIFTNATCLQKLPSEEVSALITKTLKTPVFTEDGQEIVPLQELREGHPYDTEITFFHCSSTRYFQVNLSPFQISKQSDEKLIIAVINEITEKHKTMENLEEIVHDLRGPLGLISSYAELARRSLDKADEGSKRVLEKVLSNISDASILLRLAVQQILENPNTISKQEIPVNDLLDKIGKAASILIKEKQKEQIACEVSKSPLNPLVYARESDLYTALLTLMENSIDAMENDSGMRLFVELEAYDTHVEISLRDTGCGIEEEKQKELLRRRVKTTKPKGNGIGVYRAGKLINRNNGTITFVSYTQEMINSNPQLKDKKPGTTFTIMLPLISPDVSIL